jgi:hypothetical protein
MLRYYGLWNFVSKPHFFLQLLRPLKEVSKHALLFVPQVFVVELSTSLLWDANMLAPSLLP